MKRVMLLCILFISIFSCSKSELPPNVYQVNVTAKGTYDGVRAYIETTMQGASRRRKKIAIDTAIINNEHFTFTGKLEGVKFYNLTIDGVSSTFKFVLEPGVTTIEINNINDISEAVITGGENVTAFNTYKSGLKQITDSLTSMRNKMNIARQNSKPDEYRALYEQASVVVKAISKYPFEFIKSNKKTDCSLLILEETLKNTQEEISSDAIKEMIISHTEIINKNESNKKVNLKLNAFLNKKIREEKISIGNVAPNFSGKTPEGETISLNDIKGKITIIDFWASWCVPCRIENPNFVRIYEKYHDKGLEIISVSLDGKQGQSNAKKSWIKAIKGDKLTWHHVSSLSSFRDPIATLYSIKSIPATFIIDEAGVIVSKKLRGNDLQDKIAELLD